MSRVSSARKVGFVKEPVGTSKKVLLFAVTACMLAAVLLVCALRRVVQYLGRRHYRRANKSDDEEDEEDGDGGSTDGHESQREVALSCDSGSSREVLPSAPGPEAASTRNGGAWPPPAAQ